MLKILTGDCRETLKTIESESVQCCVTSPPYFGLRDYGHDRQIGLEQTPEAFVSELVAVFREVRRVLKNDGTLWLNLGDSYNAQPGQRKVTDKAGPKQQTNRGAPGAPSRNVESLKPKDLIGIPWRVAFALQADGWYLRQDIIWAKPNPMPESVTDRCTKSHEYLFLLSKSPRYYYDAEAIKEVAECGHRGSSFVSEHDLATKPNLGKKPRPSRAKGSFNGKTEAMASTGQNAFRAVVEMRNRRSVWTVPTSPYGGAHFAVFPPALIEPCILAGTKPGDVVLDCFGGSGTTGKVALENGRQALLCELNPDYVALIEERTRVTIGLAI